MKARSLSSSDLPPPPANNMSFGGAQAIAPGATAISLSYGDPDQIIEAFLKRLSASRRTQKSREASPYLQNFLRHFYHDDTDLNTIKKDELKALRKEKPTLSNLPSSSIAIERSEKISEVNSKLSSKNLHYLAISGFAGSGKTHLSHCIARRLANELEQQKRKCLVREFRLDEGKSLVSEYSAFIKTLDLQYIGDIDLESLSEAQLFNIIKDGLDLEYTEHFVIFIYDNVDKSADKPDGELDKLEGQTVKKEDLLDRVRTHVKDNWFQTRQGVRIITTQVSNFFSNPEKEVLLSGGMTLDQAFALLDFRHRDEQTTYLREKRGVNLSAPSDELVFDDIPLPESASPRQKEIHKAAISTLELIKEFNALPLGLLIARKYIEIELKGHKEANRVDIFLEKVRAETENFLKFLEDFCSLEMKESYRKQKGALSQVSAARAMILSADLNVDNMWNTQTHTTGKRISEILQLLAFTSNQRIPSFFVDIICGHDPNQTDEFTAKRFISTLRSASMILDEAIYERFISDGKVKKFPVFTIHTQTQVAARSLIGCKTKQEEDSIHSISADHRQKAYDEHIQSVIDLLKSCYQHLRLGDSRNIDVKNLLADHLFRLLEYIDIQAQITNNVGQPSTSFKLDQVVEHCIELIESFIEINTNPEWPRKLLDEKILKQSRSKSLMAKLFENLVDCYAEMGKENKKIYFAKRAIIHYRNELYKSGANSSSAKQKHLKNLLNNNQSRLVKKNQQNNDILKIIQNLDRSTIISLLRVCLHSPSNNVDNILNTRYLEQCLDCNDNKVSTLLDGIKIKLSLLSQSKIDTQNKSEKLNALLKDINRVKTKSKVYDWAPSFQAACLYLQLQKIRNAEKIIDDMLEHNESYPHEIRFIDDVKIAKIVCLISSGAYLEASKKKSIFDTLDSASIGRTHLAYLFCLANVLQDMKNKKSQSVGHLKEAEKWLEILAKNPMHPVEYHALSAYICLHNNEKKQAREKINLYFSATQDRIFAVCSQQIERYTTRHAKRVFYFMRNPMLRVTRNNFDWLIQPRNLSADIYCAERKPQEGYRELIKYVDELPAVPDKQVIRRINKLYTKIAKVYLSIETKYRSLDEFTAAMDIIKKQDKLTVDFYHARCKVALGCSDDQNKAITELTRLITMICKDKDTYKSIYIHTSKELAAVFCRQSQFVKAKSTLDDLVTSYGDSNLAKDPTNKEIAKLYHKIAQHSMKNTGEDNKAVLSCLVSAVTIDPNNYELHLAFAKRLQKEGQLAKAIHHYLEARKLCTKGSKEYKDSSSHAYDAIMSYTKVGIAHEKNEKTSLLKIAVEIRPSDKAPYHYLLECMMSSPVENKTNIIEDFKTHFDQLITLYRQRRNKRKESIDANVIDNVIEESASYEKYADFLLVNGCYDRAKNACEISLSLNKTNDVSKIIHAGICLKDKRNVDLAKIKISLDSVALSKLGSDQRKNEASEHYLSLGKQFESKDDTKKNAISCYQRAIEFNTTNQSASEALGRCLRESRQLEELMQKCKSEYHQDKTESHRSHFYDALVESASLNYTGSLMLSHKRYNEAIMLMPNKLEAYEHLVYELYRNGLYSSSLFSEIDNKIKDKKLSSFKLDITRAWIYLRQAKFNEAKNIFQCYLTSHYSTCRDAAKYFFAIAALLEAESLLFYGLEEEENNAKIESLLLKAISDLDELTSSFDEAHSFVLAEPCSKQHAELYHLFSQVLLKMHKAKVGSSSKVPSTLKSLSISIGELSKIIDSKIEETNTENRRKSFGFYKTTSSSAAHSSLESNFTKLKKMIKMFEDRVNDDLKHCTQTKNSSSDRAISSIKWAMSPQIQKGAKITQAFSKYIENRSNNWSVCYLGLDNQSIASKLFESNLRHCKNLALVDFGHDDRNKKYDLLLHWFKDVSNKHSALRKILLDLEDEKAKEEYKPVSVANTNNLENKLYSVVRDYFQEINESPYYCQSVGSRVFIEHFFFIYFGVLEEEKTTKYESLVHDFNIIKDKEDLVGERLKKIFPKYFNSESQDKYDDYNQSKQTGSPVPGIQPGF